MTGSPLATQRFNEEMRELRSDMRREAHNLQSTVRKLNFETGADVRALALRLEEVNARMDGLFFRLNTILALSERAMRNIAQNAESSGAK